MSRPAFEGLAAILFDMDGTLVDSTASVELLWQRWAARHNLDAELILQSAHGRRNIDVVRQIAPHLDAQLEAVRLDADELALSNGSREISGAGALLRSLLPAHWAVVTSAHQALAAVRMNQANLPPPSVLVSSDDVTSGKPDPSGYRLAASRLGVPPEQCLVVEDTPAGLDAGRAAGMRLLAVTTTYATHQLNAEAHIRDFQSTRVVLTHGGLSLWID